ncbi:MAG TPA: glycosyltransferase family 2 protein [Candidatus Nitrosopolaris sp.]|nr:glycosyltransferase family 2 protein [Candidatus Nitrosopolaris sp.]
MTSIKKATTEIQALEKKLIRHRQLWQNGKLSAQGLLDLERQIEADEVTWSSLKLKLDRKPIVSVVMSALNAQRFIKASVTSILDQSLKDFEVIFIDDGSSDDTAGLIQSFNDSRIRLIHQTNHGLVHSFNKGVRLARGEFIARMDADDISLPSRFEKQLAWLSARPKRALVGTFFSRVGEDFNRPLDSVMFAPFKHIDLVRSFRLVNPFGHGSVMVRKSAIDKTGGYRAEYEPAEDFDLWWRIAQEWEIGLIPEVLYLWRFHKSNISIRKSRTSNNSALKSVNNVWAHLGGFKSPLRIVWDAHFYRQYNIPMASSVYKMYVKQQEILAAEFFQHKRLLNAWSTTLALIWLKPEFLSKVSDLKKGIVDRRIEL